ncbi:MAG: SanA/YdcF family protein [Bacteroidia bacterium]
MIKWIGKLIRLGVLTLFIVLMMYNRVEKDTEHYLYSNISEVPRQKVGLLLGTSKYVGSGNINLFYKYRISSTINLYKAGKIKYILISGDNSRSSYDEPTSMKEDLIAAGIPADVIYLDYAGFRTLDSIVRCKKVFGTREVMIISQEFHNRRAIYLAQANEMKAIGFNAQDIAGRYGLKTHIREYLARTKMFLDIWVGKGPKLLGEKIQIG